VTDPRPCPACLAPRARAQDYLCAGCWWTLPKTARTLLGRRDSQARGRLLQLYRQIRDGVPLHKIQITNR
jgi:hypothetical protein